MSAIPHATGPAAGRSHRNAPPLNIVKRMVSGIVSVVAFLGMAGLLPGGAAMAAPAISVTPDRATIALTPGQMQAQPLTILNGGTDPLDWQLLNQNVDVRDFRREAALKLDQNEYYFASAVIDPAGRYAYFGTSSPPGQLVKVDLQTWQRVGSIVMPDIEGGSGEGFLFSGVIESSGKYAYFGTGTYPAKVIKIDLEHFKRVDAITMEQGEDVLRAAVIDPAGRFAYFASDTAPVSIIKIDLQTFTRAGALVLGDDQSYTQRAATIDHQGRFAYFGVNWGTVVKIDLTNFTAVNSIDTIDPSLGTMLGSALIDPDDQYAYFGTSEDPGRIVKIDLATFTQTGLLTLADGEARPAAAVMSPDGSFAYFGTLQTAPGRVVKVDLATFARAGAITLNTGEDDLRAAVANPINGELYFAAATFPGQVIKVTDALYNCALPTWASVVPGSGTIVGGASQSVNVGFNATGMAVGQHAATVCLQSNDPARSRVVVPLTVDVRWADVTPQTFAFDVVRGSNGSQALSIVNRGSASLGWTIAQADPVQGCSAPATAAWLSASPSNGTLAAGATANVGVAVDSADLASGPYAAQLCVTATVGADTQTSAVPVALNVREPTPALALAPGNLSIAMPSNQSASANLSLFNLGTGVLDWTLQGGSVAAHLDSTLTFDAGDSAVSAAIVDANGRFAYFGSRSTPGKIVKVDLETLASVGTITLANDENVGSAVIDPSGRYAYFGSGYAPSPGRVIKVDLGSFSRVGTLDLADGEQSLAAAVIARDGAYAYFGTRTENGTIVKIDLANFTRVGSINLDSSLEEGFLYSAALDRTGAYAYFGSGVLSSRLVKVDLSSFQRVGSIVIADDQGSGPVLIDRTGDFAYVGTQPPFIGISHLVKVDLSSFQPVDMVDLDIDNTEGGISAAVIDPAGRSALVGTTWGSATRLVEINLDTFSRVSAVSLGVAEGGLNAAAIAPDGHYAYFGGQLYPGGGRSGRVYKIETHRNCVLPSWLTVGESSGVVAAGSSHDVGVTASSHGLSVGVHDANLCFASNDPDRPVQSAPIELTVTAASDAIFADGFETRIP